MCRDQRKNLIISASDLLDQAFRRSLFFFDLNNRTECHYGVGVMETYGVGNLFRLFV